MSKIRELSHVSRTSFVGSICAFPSKIPYGKSLPKNNRTLITSQRWTAPNLNTRHSRIMHNTRMRTHARFRFYAELNELIAPINRYREVERHCPPGATVKHMIEVFGVPHTEVEWVIVNGQAADFNYRMHDRDHVAVHPASVAPEIAHTIRLPGRPLRGVRFIADAHLGQLAKRLRILGFDVLYDNAYHDRDLADIFIRDDRIVLTRDRSVLIQKTILRGCFLHSKTSNDQVREVLARCHAVDALHPFTRCLECNGALLDVDKQKVAHLLPERSGEAFDHFRQCKNCGKVYWGGSHKRQMQEWVARILGDIAHD
jgi:uncharacterized protein with PIN domain